jgi:hypothetical protein
VVVFGVSSDIMELHGAISDEAYCYFDGTIYLDETGILENKCEECACPYFEEIKERAKKIVAICHENQDKTSTFIPWTYKTDIQHTTFNIKNNESEDAYCVGIVFSINDLK